MYMYTHSNRMSKKWKQNIQIAGRLLIVFYFHSVAAMSPACVCVCVRERQCV